MATSIEYIEFVARQLEELSNIRYRKMFGEYMVYLNDRPVATVCDDTVFVKKLDNIAELMQDAEVGFPYVGAKEHYILDIDNAEFSQKIVKLIEEVTPPPKPKKPKATTNKKETGSDGFWF